MGTRFEMILCESAHHAVGSDESQVFLRAVGEQAIEVIESWDRMLSRFAAGGVPMRLMLAAKEGYEGQGRFVPLDSRVFSLLRFCEFMRLTTDGAFDVSYESNRARSVAFGIDFDAAACSARLSDTGQTLDFGAVGKGFALDCVAELLREHGITRALVHGGTSSVLAVGEWKIGVKLDDVRECVITLKNAHLSVSSTKHRTHIVDTRRSAEGTATSAVHTAAVLSPLLANAASANERTSNSGTLAECWSTALTILGKRSESVPPSLTTLLLHTSGEIDLVGPSADHFAIR